MKKTVLIVLMILFFSTLYAQTTITRKIVIKEVEGLLKIYTPGNKEILVSAGEKYPEIPSGSRVKLLLKGAKIAVGEINMVVDEKSNFKVWNSNKNSKIKILVDSSSKGNIRATLKDNSYIIEPKEEILVSFDKKGTKAVIEATLGDITVVTPKGDKTLAKGKKHGLKIKASAKKSASPKEAKTAKKKTDKKDKKEEKKEMNIKITKRTGTIKVYLPDGTIKTFKKNAKLSSIPMGSLIVVTSGILEVDVDKIPVTIEKAGIIQFKYDEKNSEVDFIVSKKSKGRIKAVVGDNKIFLTKSDKISIKFDTNNNRYYVNVIRGNIRVLSPKGEIYLSTGKTLETKPLVQDTVTVPEFLEPQLEEASPSSP